MTALALKTEYVPSDLRVELLRDGKGIYGVGTVGDGWRPAGEGTCRFVVRPDRLEGGSEQRRWSAIYQRITLGSLFRHTGEGELRRALFAAMLDRAGLIDRDDGSDGPPLDFDEATKRDTLRHRAREERWPKIRNHWHALKGRSLGIVNQLIGQALEEAADQDAVKAARRFPFKIRQPLYEAFAREGPRTVQLAHSFPVLAVLIYTGRVDGAPELKAHYEQAATMVRAGASLRRIAAECELPLAMKKFKPGVARRALELLALFNSRPSLIHAYLPETQPKMRQWLKAVVFASNHGDRFLEWTAKHCMQIGGSFAERVHLVQDIADWVNVSEKKRAIEGIEPDAWETLLRAGIISQDGRDPATQFVTRFFSPGMTPETALKLSEEWHLAVANSGENGGFLKFPEPWWPVKLLGTLTFEPITTAAELYREGHEMRHCVSSYAADVATGRKYVYRVVNGSGSVATIELGRGGHGDGPIMLGQVRGKCNAAVPRAVLKAVQKWFAENRREQSVPPPAGPATPFDVDDFDDLPF